MAVFILFCGHVLAQDQKVWVGHRFQPSQCRKIQQGQFEVNRKLCNIKYDIKPHNLLFKIDGLLEFNQKFVPTQPKRVELEVLFIDDQYVCRKQINQLKKVVKTPVPFSIVAEDIANYKYIRTYYTLYYTD
jgi:hypothetical protein